MGEQQTLTANHRVSEHFQSVGQGSSSSRGGQGETSVSGRGAVKDVLGAA